MDNARYADAALTPDVVFTVHAVTGQINAANNGADVECTLLPKTSAPDRRRTSCMTTVLCSFLNKIALFYESPN